MKKNYDTLVKINHNPNWPHIPDYLYKILIIGCSGSGKTNVLLNLIKHKQPEIDKIYWYVKDPSQSKYQLLINGIEKVWIENLINQKAFIDYSHTIDDAYQNLEDYNPTQKNRVLIVFDDMIAWYAMILMIWWYDMESNNKLCLIVTELILRKENSIFHLFLFYNLIQNA